MVQEGAAHAAHLAETKVRRLEAELENAREESEAAERGRARDRAQLERSVDALTVELTNVRQDAICEVSSLREAVAQAESSRRACELELETSACALREHTARADQALSELAAKDRELVAGRAQLAEVRAQLEREAENAKSANNKVREQEAQRCRSLSQRHAMAAEALKAESVRLTATCATLRDELAEASRKCCVETEERARLQASNAAHVRSEAKLAQECEELRERLRIEVAASERWGHLLQEAQAAQFDAVSQLEAARQHAKEARANLETEASDAQRAAANIGRDLAAERARVESLGEETQRLRDAMSQLRLAEADWHAQRDTLLRDQSALRDELAASELAAATVSGAFSRSQEESARELARAKAAVTSKADQAVAAAEQKMSEATANIAAKVRQEWEARLHTQRAELEQEAQNRAATAVEQEAERCHAAAQVEIAAAVKAQQEDAVRAAEEWAERVRTQQDELERVEMDAKHACARAVALEAERCREAAQDDIAAAIKAQMDEAARAAEAKTRAREALDKCAQLEEALENARRSLGAADAGRAVADNKLEMMDSAVLKRSMKTMVDVSTATNGEAKPSLQALRAQCDALAKDLNASRTKCSDVTSSLDSLSTEHSAMVAALRGELQEARDQVCVCVPCKCLDGCDPGQNITVNLMPLVSKTCEEGDVACFGTQTDNTVGGDSSGTAASGAAAGSATSASDILELRDELSEWQQRANERGEIIAAQSAWRRQHLEREVEIVRQVDIARKAAKKWKSVAKRLEKGVTTAVSASTGSVQQVVHATTQTRVADKEENNRPKVVTAAATQTKPAPATLEVHAQTDEAATEPASHRAASCAGTQTAGVTEIEAAHSAAGPQEVAVLKHALRKLQAELTEVRIAFDIRSPQRSFSPSRRGRRSASAKQASSPRVILGEITQ